MRAQDSQFGEPLYPVKLATERVRLVLAFSASDKASTHLDIAQTRLDELTNATVAGKADVAKKLAAQYRSNVIEALARAAQATENRSERAKNRLHELQDRLQVHQSVLGALGNEMPEILDGKGKGQPEGLGKPGDVGKPESTGKPEDAGKPEGAGKPDDAGIAPGVGGATNECVWVQTGDQNRYQVWCCGVHLIVNLGDADEDEIEEWLTNEGLCVKAETAAEDEDATALIKALEDPESGVEQFNFYGPLSQLNLDRVENGGDVEDAEEAEEGEEANVTVQGNIRSMKGARWVLTVGDEERTVIVLGSASIEGVPQKGKKVEVTGKEKGDGTIQATIVVMIGD